MLLNLWCPKARFLKVNRKSPTQVKSFLRLLHHGEKINQERITVGLLLSTFVLDS